jgi:diguanylate cyclase (GGDEF)-like protein
LQASEGLFPNTDPQTIIDADMLKRLARDFSFKGILEKWLDRPWIVIMIVVGVTALFATQIPSLSFKTSINDLIIEDLPETERYDAFKEVFGSDEIIRVVIKATDIFDDPTFKKIEVLAEQAAAIKGVRRVLSLPEIRKNIDMSGDKSLSEIAQILDGVQLFRKNLYSPDHKETVLTLVLEQDVDPDTVIQAVQDVIAAAPKELSLYQIGMPLVSQALAQLTQKDFLQLPPLTFLLIAVVLLLLYRKFIYLLLPLTCVSFALIWTFGFMALTRIPLSMLTMIVPVFLIAVGTAYCLHIIAEYLTQVQQVATPREAALATFTNVTLPTILAILTTAIGLGSLLVNRITTIREFAVFACFGIFSFMAVLLTFMPAVMAIIPFRKSNKKMQPGKLGFFDRLLDWIARLDLDHQRITLPLLGIITVFCLIGIFKVRVETNPVGYFKADVPVSQHFHDIYKNLSGSFPINVSMTGNEEDFFENPEHIADIARLQRYIETLPGVDKTISFADYLQLVNYASNRYEAEYYRLPEEGFEVRMLINSYRMMLGEDMLTRFMKPDFSQANIMLLTHISSSRVFLETRQKILDYAKENFSKDLTWDVTGFGMVISESSRQLTNGQVKSLSLTMVLVFGIMFLLFLSSKVGAIAIVPNLFPIIVNFGIMGWFNVELSMVTSLIASIAIGLAVDDTIHYLVRYNREFRQDLDDKRAVRETIKHIGQPIIATTLTISVGFAILAFSSFKPTAIFGIMMVITMVSALIGDLIILPSLMLHVELVTLWDLVRLKLGMEPRQGIPLFKGLSRTQVHYIVMAGSLQQFEAGQVLFRKGDQSETMYAVISGQLDVVEHEERAEAAQVHGIQKLITRLHPGQVVGEMGLLRGAPRSATVIASENSELLQINWKMIQRLQWLYPPTAVRFVLNLMTMICDRLEDVTDCFSGESIVDDLTGLHNRRGFVNILTIETNRALRYNEDLTLCLMGIDVNTSAMGSDYTAVDRLFRAFGRTLAREIRKCDSLGRIDLQTFALLITQATTEKSETVWRRLQQALNQELGQIHGAPLKLTFTITNLRHATDKTGAELMARAMEAFSKARERQNE